MNAHKGRSGKKNGYLLCRHVWRKLGYTDLEYGGYQVREHEGI